MQIQVFLSTNLEAMFKPVDADGFEGPLAYVKIINTMDQPVIVSFDGVNNHEYIPADDSINLNAQVCSSDKNKKSLFRSLSKVYVKKVDNFPKGGTLVVSGFYQ